MSYTNLNYHIVFATKDRRPLITADVKERLVKYIGGIARDHDCTLCEANGPEDHFHLVAMVHPSVPLADFILDVKANSSKWIHATFPKLADFQWQDGYSAFTVSKSILPQVVEYVQKQAEHHKTIAFKDELVALLKKHGIAYDERYVGV